MMSKYVVAAALLICAPAQKPPQPTLHKPGQFHGRLVLLPLPDGINMKLLEEFGYTDWEGDTLTAPVGFVTDGASIPRALWTIVGGPWDGKYRGAAVVHDVGCDTRQLTWQATDELFYDAMIDLGVSQPQAITMYLGVYLGGPRWQLIAQSQSSTPQQVVDKQAQASKTLRPDESIAVDLGTPRYTGEQPEAAIEYTPKFYAVTATKEINSDFLKEFMAQAEQREKAGNPITPEEAEQKAIAATASQPIK